MTHVYHPSVNSCGYEGRSGAERTFDKACKYAFWIFPYALEAQIPRGEVFRRRKIVALGLREKRTEEKSDNYALDIPAPRLGS